MKRLGLASGEAGAQPEGANPRPPSSCAAPPAKQGLLTLGAVCARVAGGGCGVVGEGRGEGGVKVSELAPVLVLHGAQP